MKVNVRNNTEVGHKAVNTRHEKRGSASPLRRIKILSRHSLVAVVAFAVMSLAGIPAATQVGHKARQPSASKQNVTASQSPNRNPGKSPQRRGKNNRRVRSNDNYVATEIASIETSPPVSSSLQPYIFETVKFHPSGTVAVKSQGRAEYFDEDLGGGVKLTMVKIPGNTFRMGTADAMVARITAEQQRYCGNDDCRAGVAAAIRAETPQRDVTVPAFMIGKFEVTQAQWRAVAGMKKIRRDLRPEPSKFKDPRRPVDSVSWEDAVEFCARLSQNTGRTYRLPTESEWEYACRSETATEFAFGETIFSEFINFDGNYPYEEGAKGIFSVSTRPVEWARPVLNGFGLSGMHGNVAEWCQDKWHGSYDGAPVDASARAGKELSATADRVVRGGAWSDHASRCRSAFRTKLHPRSQPPTVGMRVVMDGA